MTTYLIINLCVSAVLIGWLGYQLLHNKRPPSDSLAFFLFVVQVILCYVVWGSLLHVGPTKITALPAKDFQILKTDDRVILVTPKKVTEFFDVKTYNTQEYKTVIKTESYNAYGFSIKTEYQLK